MRKLGLLAVCASWGCEELEPYEPKVTFDSLNVHEVDWEQVQVDFVFEVENPNPISVSLASFDYALEFSDVEWLTGDDPDGLTLQASDSSELALPVQFGFEELYEMVQAVRGEDTIPFGLSGNFGFDTPIGLIELPYSEEGTFPALRTPVIQASKLRVSSLSWTGAELELDLSVDNDHESNLTFLEFDYSLALAGVDVGSGSVDSLGEVEGASTDTLTLPLEIGFGSAAMALYEALTGSSVDLDLDATTLVDTPFGQVPLDLALANDVDIE